MRVLSIGLDGRVGFPEERGHAAVWAREMAQLVEEYVVLAESPDGRIHGPVALAKNASAYLLPGSPLTYPFRAATFARRLHSERPFDVVTTEDPIRAGLAGLRFSQATGVPLNVENHSFHINEPVWLREKVHHRFYNRIAIHVCRHADTIRNYSPGQTPALRGIGVPAERIHVVPIAAPEMSGVPREEARRRLDLGPEPLVFSAGRMVAYKNIPLLLRAFQALPAALNARLLLIGTGSARAEWEAECSGLGLDGRVTWRDSVPWDTMPLYFSAADVFAAPALHETGPRTVLEALLCECPVVLTPEMGVVHTGHCVHGESALVAAPDDVPGWSGALQTVLSDPRGAVRLAEAGRARIGPDVSLSAIARRMTDLLAATAARRAPGAPDPCAVMS